MLSDLLYRARSIFRRRRVESEFDDELRFHFEQQVDANLRAGMTLQGARREARLKFGGFDQLKQELHDAHGASFFDSLAQDMRFAGRMLMRSPGFTLVAVLTLALGIGTNVAIFSYIDAWLIKGLPYPQSEQLVVVNAHDRQQGWISTSITPGDYYSLLEETPALASLAAGNSANFNFAGDGTPERIAGATVTWSFFDTLGIKLILGRNFQRQEDRPGANHVVILSRGLWASRFAFDANIIGRAININGESYTVVGVAPANFQFPLIGAANLWTPMAWADAQRASREGAGYVTVGRLRDGASFGEADSQMRGIGRRLEQQYPATNKNEDFYLGTLRDEILKNEGGQQIIVCFWIVGLVLLIACVNVANLMLARATGRAKEMAVRGALGATRRRIARQLLTESVILFSLGGLAGLLFGILGMSWVDSLIPDNVRGFLVNYGHVQMDLVTLSYSVGIAFLCGIVFGLIPALQVSKLDLNGALKENSGQSSSGRRGSRTRRIFVIAEIAVAVVVLITTALLVQSFAHMISADPGFRPGNLITAQVELPKGKYSSADQIRDFYERTLERMRALPQVQSAAVSQVVPFSRAGEFAKIFRANGPAQEPKSAPYAQYAAVTPGYFSTMGIVLQSGRAFTDADVPGSAPVVIISDRLKQQLWPDADPLGQQLLYGDDRTVATIVGVAANVKLYNMAEKPRREFYLPFAQAPSRSAGIVVRSTSADATLAIAMRDVIWSVDPQQPISQVSLLNSLIKDAVAPNLVLSQLAGFFGLLALLLGAIGIYGVMAHSVTQRTSEIGIRVALGARPAQVIALVIGEGLKLALIGIVAGALFALAVTRSMASILYDVKTSDPILFSAVAILFAVVAALACCIPAWRALRIDPTIALRYE